MIAGDIIRNATAAGLTLAARGDQLAVMPATKLSADLRLLLITHKTELLAYLRQPTNDSAPRDSDARPTYGTNRDTQGRALPVTVRCGDCTNFAPSQYSPDAGIGTCAHGEPDQGGVPYFPIGQRRCAMFTPVMTAERVTSLEPLR